MSIIESASLALTFYGGTIGVIFFALFLAKQSNSLPKVLVAGSRLPALAAGVSAYLVCDLVLTLSVNWKESAVAIVSMFAAIAAAVIMLGIGAYSATTRTSRPGWN